MEENSQESGLFQSLDIRTIVGRILNYVIHYFWLLLLFAAIGASAMWYRAKVTYIPYYQCSVSCTINSNYSDYGDINYLTTTKNLSNMFYYLTSTDTFKDMLKKELGTERINGTISAYVAETSNLLTVTVTSGNPQDAYNILLATIKCYPDIADYVVGTVYFHVITPASVPTEPVNVPDYKGPAKTGALIGAGVILAVFALLSLFDNRVNDSDDIERRMNVRCLAVIPEISLKKRKKSTNIPITILNPKVGYVFKESYRGLRTKIKKYCDRNGWKVILVSSPMPGEGKTTTAVNIALSLAEISDKVVLVDADLRKPSVADRLKMPNEHFSINTVLKGRSEVLESLTDVEGSSLKVLTGGNGVKNALECMGSEKMKNIIEELREHFEYVIIDTPPCGIMSDASMIARYTDGAIMVVRYNRSKVSYVSHALSLLAGDNIPVIGCILNCKKSEISEAVSGYKRDSYRYGKYNTYGRYGRYGKYGGYGQKSSEAKEAKEDTE